jgi:hypothetical protein
MTAPAQARPAIANRGTARRLLVTRRDPESRLYEPVGFLSVDDGLYRFRYLRAALASDTFRPLPGLPVGRGSLEDVRLFPLFAERIMSPRRSDRPTVLEALGLGLDAEPFEVLARSGGRRVGDTIELVPAPDLGTDGSITLDFFVHGVRYMTPRAQERITGLTEDETLRLVPDPDNAADCRAVLVTDQDAVRLGYVPGPLLGLVHDMSSQEVRVLRANGPSVGFHFRLLVRLTGSMPVGARPFAGPEWETAD